MKITQLYPEILETLTYQNYKQKFSTLLYIQEIEVSIKYIFLQTFKYNFNFEFIFEIFNISKMFSIYLLKLFYTSIQIFLAEFHNEVHNLF